MTKNEEKNRRGKPESQPSIVIVGANFAGLKTALDLPRDYRVTVIDFGPYFEFLPNIHELLSGLKTPKNLRLDKKRLIERAGHRFIRKPVSMIDPENKKVMTAGGKKLRFDICVVAIGGMNNTYGIEGANEFGLPFKSVEQCRKIGERLGDLYREKNRSSIVIVGGGLEGVEALGEILRRYRRDPKFEIHVIEKNDRLLQGKPAAVDRDIRKICKPYPVHFHTGTMVDRITEDSVLLSTGEILDTDATIWTGGAIARSLLYESGLSNQAGEWAPVTNTLQSINFESVFVAGDGAELPKPVSKQAYYALQMGERAAKNIQALCNGERIKDFRPSHKPTIISFGDLQTYLLAGNFALAGTFLASAKEGVYQVTMAKLDPPDKLSAIKGLYNRTSESFMNLTVPTLTSLASLIRLTNVRLLI